MTNKLTNQEISEIMGFNKSTISRDFKTYQTDAQSRYDIEAILNSDESIRVKYYYLIASQQEEQLKEIQEKYVATNNKALQLKEELTATASQLEAAKDEALQHKSKALQLENQKEQSVATQNKLVATEKQLAVAAKKASQLESDNKDLRRNLTVATQRADATDKSKSERESLLSNQHSKLQRQHEVLQRTAVELQRSNDELQRSNKLLQNNKDKLQHQVILLQRNNTVATESSDELQRNNEQLQRSVDNLENDKSELQSQVDELQRDNASVQQLKVQIQNQRKDILEHQLNNKQSKNAIKQIATSEWFTYLFLSVTMSATFGFAIREMIGGDLLGAVAHWTEYIPRVLTALVLAVAMIWIAFSNLPKKYKVTSMIFYGLCEWVSFSNALGLPDMIVGAQGMEWFKVFGIAIFSFLLPYTTYQLAHIQTDAANKFELGDVLHNIESLLSQYNIKDTMRFKNDFTELLLA